MELDYKIAYILAELIEEGPKTVLLEFYRDVYPTYLYKKLEEKDISIRFDKFVSKYKFY